MPAIQILGPGFSFSLMWELLQLPCYANTFAVAWTTLVSNRLHWSMGDACRDVKAQASPDKCFMRGRKR